MKTIKLITCKDAFQAHVIQGALQNEGIASILHNENMSGIMRGYISDITGVDVLVYEEDYEKGIRLLEQNRMIPEQPRYCPHCGSDYIKFVQKKDTGCGLSWLPSSQHCQPLLRARSIGNMYAMRVAPVLKIP